MAGAARGELGNDSEPPPSPRFNPANSPPPVLVFMSTWSFIQHMQLVWLYTTSPGARSIATVCITVPEISYFMGVLPAVHFVSQGGIA
jgi:hypothetical protein